MQDVFEHRRGIGDRAAPPVTVVAAQNLDDLNVRNDFPILKTRLGAHPLVWLDNAATTQKPRAVIDRLVRFYEHESANVHRGGHTLGTRATEAYEQARDIVRGFLNAPDRRNIVFVRGTTEAINLVAQSWASRHLHAGDEILVSALEHHSNLIPWQMAAARSGAILKFIPIDERGQLDLTAFDRLLSPRTRVLAVTHVSNALGTVTPLRDIIRRAHDRRVVVVVDGAQAVSHTPVDVQALDADFYAFSGHKVFGPTGIGVLYGTSERLEETPAWQGGGSMAAEVTATHSAYQAPPYRFEAGTPNVADAVALGAALQYVLAVGLDRVEAHDRALTTYAVAQLGRLPGLRHIGTATGKLGVTSFVIDDVSSWALGNALDADGIAVRVGHHCALPALQALGIDAVVRPSLALYNTNDDIDRLVASIARFLDQSSRAERSV